jgi:predicted nucleotide-binding protein
MTSPYHLGTTPPLQDPTTASLWVPLWRIIEMIASAIGDRLEAEHYAKTRLYIRQAAAEGRLRIRGRHEIEVAGQERTNFSEIYTQIPSAYWKHSVINVLATGAAFEGDRQTDPEKTPYSWGPKGLYEPNCYTGLQLNSDDVSQLIADARGTGLLADAQMPEEEEWISAQTALDLLDIGHHLGTRTICKRAYAGLVKARAKLFIRDERSTHNVDVPKEFWWAEGEDALHQNWKTGDFDTWINQQIRVKAFSVTFRRSDIEQLRPARALQEGQEMTATGKKIFIGHGRSLVWLELKNFLQDDLHLAVDEFNRVSTAGIATSNRLEQMLDDAAFAFLILTAEDEATDGKLHARENVVHEAGLFQGRLGFTKAILLLEETCEKFSNIEGLGYIPFTTGKIRAAFEDIRKVLNERLIALEEKSADGSGPSGPPRERKGRLQYTYPRTSRDS